MVGFPNEGHTSWFLLSKREIAFVLARITASRGGAQENEPSDLKRYMLHTFNPKTRG